MCGQMSSRDMRS